MMVSYIVPFLQLGHNSLGAVRFIPLSAKTVADRVTARHRISTRESLFQICLHVVILLLFDEHPKTNEHPEKTPASFLSRFSILGKGLPFRYHYISFAARCLQGRRKFGESPCRGGLLWKICRSMDGPRGRSFHPQPLGQRRVGCDDGGFVGVVQHHAGLCAVCFPYVFHRGVIHLHLGPAVLAGVHRR